MEERLVANQKVVGSTPITRLVECSREYIFHSKKPLSTKLVGLSLRRGPSGWGRQIATLYEVSSILTRALTVSGRAFPTGGRMWVLP